MNVFVIFVNLLPLISAIDLINIGAPLARIQLRKYTIIEEEDSECLKQLKIYAQDSFDKELWALFMEDATGKPNPGLFTANLILLGNYDQCLSIEIERNGSNILGQYCRTIVNDSLYTDQYSKRMFNKTEVIKIFGIDNKEAKDLLNNLQLYWDICLPAICSSEELQDIWNEMEKREKIRFHMEFDDFMCSSRESVSQTPLRDHIIMGVFVFLFIVVLLSTCYDLIIFQRQKDSNLNIWMAFSLYTNGKKLFTIRSTHRETIPCLNGLKALSIMWIVLGHRFLLYYTGIALNSSYVFEWEKHEENMLILGATASVDTFFTISGFLIIYVIMQMVERNIKISLPVFYLHRLLRLTPALAAMVAFTIGCLIHLGNGPFWYFINQYIRGYCIENWWATLLYVQNYVHPLEQCVGQSWYLAVDTQLYFLSPLLFFPLIRWPKTTIGIILILILSSTIFTFLVTWFVVKSSFYVVIDEEFYEKIYIATHTRVSPWLIGVLFGYWMSKTKSSKVYLRKCTVLLLWIMALGTMLSVIFGNITFTKYDYHVIQPSLYNSLAKIGWSLAICWVIFACSRGYGGIVNTFLSLPLFTVLGRLTYGIYLVHFMLLSLVAGQRRTSDYLYNLHSIHSFWGDYMFSVGFAIIWTLVFESPIRILETIIIGKDKLEELNKPSDQQINNIVTLKIRKSVVEVL